MSSTPKFKGAPVELGGETFIIAPLSLGALETLGPAMVEFAAGVNQTKTSIDIVHAALTRNYPEMTRAQVADLVDVQTMNAVVDAVMGVSGVKKKEEGEAPGNVPA